MAASSSTMPSTPEPVNPRRVAMARSITVPPKLSLSTRTAPTPEIGAADGIETLYVHPSASIIKFNTGGSRPSSSSGSPLVRNGENAGIPWTYPTESTVAVGPMEIYRVPGSVSFLHSGALLHAILPRSQCWCVDGVSKFAFRVLPETYYRIELPGQTEEDLERVEALKNTLKKVLFYEKTPCPFARGFTVELPKEEVKLKKKNSVRDGPAKKWRMEKTYSWKPEGWEEEKLKRDLSAAGARSSEEEEETESSGEEVGASSNHARQTGQQNKDETSTPTPSRLQARPQEPMRAVTAPPQLQAQSTPSSRVRSRVQAVESVDRAEKAEKVRFHAEVERRSSVRVKRLSTIPIDLPPSPPDSSAGAEAQRQSDFDEGSETIEEETDEAETGTETENETEASECIVPAPEILPPQDAVEEDSSTTGDEAGESDDDAAPENDQLQTPPIEPRNDDVKPVTRAPEPEPEIIQYTEDSLPRQLAETSLTKSHSQVRFEAHEDPPTSSKPSATTTGSRNTQRRSETAPQDPYAAIQARIQARRSIGGTTTSFHPITTIPTRTSTASTASSATVTTQRPQKPKRTVQHQSVTAALVNKACAVFLGPPAHLVTMMLRIAARFSSGAFGSNSMFFVESPIGSPRRVPGSFYLEDEEDQAWKSDGDEWDEDDFGVPLKSPARISGLRERARREGWEVD